MHNVILMPEPLRKPGFVARSVAWGKHLNREAAIDSARNVFAVVGVTSSMAYLSTMPWFWMPFSIAILAGAWYADYLRHF